MGIAIHLHFYSGGLLCVQVCIKATRLPVDNCHSSLVSRTADDLFANCISLRQRINVFSNTFQAVCQDHVLSLPIELATPSTWP